MHRIYTLWVRYLKRKIKMMMYIMLYSLEILSAREFMGRTKLKYGDMEICNLFAN